MKKFLLFLPAVICVGMVQARVVIVPHVTPHVTLHAPVHIAPVHIAPAHPTPATVKPVQITPRIAKAYRPLCYTPLAYRSPHATSVLPLAMFWWYPCFVPHSYPYRVKPTGTNTVTAIETKTSVWNTTECEK